MYNNQLEFGVRIQIVFIIKNILSEVFIGIF